AEDGIRDFHVTGVQTCALPIFAMVNGWCFGGAFTPLVACDLAIAAEEAIFGLSEINWGILPAGNVTKAVTETMGLRNALYYVMRSEERRVGKECRAPWAGE